MKEKKLLSHFERLNLPCLKCSIERPYVRVMKEETVFDERIQRYVRKVSYVTEDRKEQMKNYQLSDFSLDNLTAIGAKLSPMIMGASDDMRNSGALGYIKSVEEQLNKISE